MVEVLHGDCVEQMRLMPDCSVDAIVTDPPYELGFMGKAWDGAGIAYSVTMWAEALRVLKPGGHLLAFGGTRTYHRMACAIEDAGFEIRDSIHWVYGSGFPKSLDVSKAIDKAAGAEREVLGLGAAYCPDIAAGRECAGHPTANRSLSGLNIHAAATAAATDEARRWEGWGTALKPAHEPIVVARKPLVGTVAGNVLAYGTGGLNIDGCRVGTDGGGGNGLGSHFDRLGDTEPRVKHGQDAVGSMGRWPANVVFDRTAGEALDEQSGERPGGTYPGTSQKGPKFSGRTYNGGQVYAGKVDEPPRTLSDSGGASRFFTQADWGPDDWPFVYQAKPSRKERNAGLDGLPAKFAPTMGNGIGGKEHDPETATRKQNTHPTVKPVALMRHLVRLVTPPGGVVLDPFAGSGTTLVAAIFEGFDAIGIEMTDEYLPIIQGRVAWAEEQVAAEPPRLL